ncbi:hypothetical protein ACJJIC_17435 [Microbulbifer sp. ANSA002]|uniref:hypothetical protein n=1 Tax=unclassified Microbulbifer TaxID=2619833 RepID=UPI0040411242
MHSSSCFIILLLFILGCGVVSEASAIDFATNESYITGEVAKMTLLEANELGIKVEVEENTETVSEISLLLSEDLSEAVKCRDVEISGNVLSAIGDLIVSTPPISRSGNFNVQKGLVFRISFVSRRDIGMYKAGTTYVFDIIDY